MDTVQVNFFELGSQVYMSGLRGKGGRSRRGVYGAEHSSLSCTLGSEASMASLLFNLVLSAHYFAYFRCF